MANLIDKDALIAEIERRRNAALMRQRNLEAIGQETVSNEMVAFDFGRILSFINTLEVKDVNLERVIDKWIDDTAITHEDCSIADVISTAKHFFELGIKTMKGE